MSLQKTVTDIGSGARDTVRSALERSPQVALKASDEFVTGAKELLSNVVHFLPATAEFAAGLGIGVESGGIAPIVLGALTLKDELARNQELRNQEGRVTNALPPGTFAQNKNSMTDPAHIIHRTVQTTADRAIPSTHVRLDSSVRPPDENTSVPIVVPKTIPINLAPVQITTPQQTPVPTTSNTGGVQQQQPVLSGPFH